MTIPLHSRVALKSEVDELYTHAFVGSEGWVREARRDSDGFDMVKVEWDQDHWRFNGQPDGWTFADHFRVVGPPEPPRQDQAMAEDELPRQRGPNSRPTDEDIEAYLGVVSEAFDAVSESEGFMTLAIKRVPHPQTGQTMFIPAVFSHSMSQEASSLVDVQLMEMAAAIIQQLMMDRLEDR